MGLGVRVASTRSYTMSARAVIDRDLGGMRVPEGNKSLSFTQMVDALFASVRKTYPTAIQRQGLRLLAGRAPTMHQHQNPLVARPMRRYGLPNHLQRSPPHHAFIPLIRTATAALALGALAACSSTPAPTEQMAVTRTTVNRVAAAPAVTTSAPVQLQQAREKLMQAEKAMAEKDYVAARRLAAEAEVDARVAETRADAASNAANLAQVQDGIRALQEEINRRSPR